MGSKTILTSISFDYKVGPDNDKEDLPNGIFKTLSILYDEGYLTIKPVKVASRYYNNYKEKLMYSIDMDFNRPDSMLEEENKEC